MPAVKLSGADVIELSRKSDELEFFIQWAATPRAARPAHVGSQAKLAAHLGVTEQTIRNWKRDPRISSRVRQVGLGAFRIERHRDLLEKAYEQAMDTQNPRSIQATKLLFEEMSKFTEHDEQSPLSDMSLKELKSHVAELYDEIDEREASA